MHKSFECDLVLYIKKNSRRKHIQSITFLKSQDEAVTDPEGYTGLLPLFENAKKDTHKKGKKKGRGRKKSRD